MKTCFFLGGGGYLVFLYIHPVLRNKINDSRKENMCDTACCSFSSWASQQAVKASKMVDGNGSVGKKSVSWMVCKVKEWWILLLGQTYAKFVSNDLKALLNDEHPQCWNWL